MIKKIVFLGGLAMASAFSPSAFSPSLRAPSARATCKQGATATSMVWGGKDYLIAPSILSADFAKLGQEVIIRSLLLNWTHGCRLWTGSKSYMCVCAFVLGMVHVSKWFDGDGGAGPYSRGLVWPNFRFVQGDEITWGSGGCRGGREIQRGRMSLGGCVTSDRH
jgi:hypothetical protein